MEANDFLPQSKTSTGPSQGGPADPGDFESKFDNDVLSLQNSLSRTIEMHSEICSNIHSIQSTGILQYPVQYNNPETQQSPTPWKPTKKSHKRETLGS
ncbi:hypothetical protein D6D01_04502 [Aureobasidium pullulans]|uniref:Uncharacterized protein n=1 Tax=Aureobasidium pullulans TaxID=5580 RepID=A0A4S9LAJ2_AURPU|nr:hypothetical protein D6D01_04502 [Aureobasidium pullulans]